MGTLVNGAGMPLDRRAFLLSPALGLAASGAHGAQAAPTGAAVRKHLGALDHIVAEVLRRSGVPGMAVAVVDHDRVAYLKGFGVRRAGEAGPVDADTVFALASLSKPLATTVLAGIVGDGVVSWDDRVVRHEPDFALSDRWVTR